MVKNELSGVERQLVIEYLIDGNSPVTLSLINENPIDENQKTVSTKFSLASRAEQLKIMEKGIILLKDASDFATIFEEKKVRVQFYFNKLALFFVTKIQRVSTELAFLIPSVIYRIEDKVSETKKDFSVIIYCESTSESGSKINQKTDIECDFDDRFPLFYHVDYIQIIERYFSEESFEKIESIAERIHAPKVIYIDSKRIVFAANKKEMPLISGVEYTVLLKFPIFGPIKERKVYITCLIEKIYEDSEFTKTCACAKISSIYEEDARFLNDKMKSFYG